MAQFYQNSYTFHYLNLYIVMVEKNICLYSLSFLKQKSV